jgi:hypothetical protein
MHCYHRHAQNMVWLHLQALHVPDYCEQGRLQQAAVARQDMHAPQEQQMDLVLKTCARWHGQDRSMLLHPTHAGAVDCVELTAWQCKRAAAPQTQAARDVRNARADATLLPVNTCAAQLCILPLQQQ